MKLLILFFMILLFAVPAYALTVHFTNGAQLEVQNIKKIGRNYKLTLPDGKEIYYGEEVIVDSANIKPFDLSITQLPPDYKGNDIEEIFRLLEERFPEKSEFETKNDYEQRVNSSALNTICAFNNKPGRASGEVVDFTYCTYDADNKILTIGIPGINFPIQKSHLANFIALKNVIKNTESYNATNAFGAKTVVTKDTSDRYGIIILNNRDFECNFLGVHEIKVNISPEEAKILKQNLGILYICKPTLSGEPISYTTNGFYHSKPTLDIPLELSYNDKATFANLLGIWVYDKKSGKVVYKEKF